MIPISVVFHDLDNDGPVWPDLVQEDIVLNDSTQPVNVAVLQSGMLSGRPSVALRVTLENGQTAIIETSAALLCTTARMIMARYPELGSGAEGASNERKQ